MHVYVRTMNPLRDCITIVLGKELFMEGWVASLSYRHISSFTCFCNTNDIVTKPLYSQAKDNIVHLDQSIQEAHKIENQLLEVSHWITSVGTEIQNRLDADVLAGDVPEESEVSGVPWIMVTCVPLNYN